MILFLFSFSTYQVRDPITSVGKSCKCQQLINVGGPNGNKFTRLEGRLKLSYIVKYSRVCTDILDEGEEGRMTRQGRGKGQELEDRPPPSLARRPCHPDGANRHRNRIRNDTRESTDGSWVLSTEGSMRLILRRNEILE